MTGTLQSTPVASAWRRIGTVVGNASTGQYSFILRSFQAKLGDIVATRVDVPETPGTPEKTVTVWGRVVSIDRFNPFFPAEAAQELAHSDVGFLDTVLSGSRDHLEAEVLILGTTDEMDAGTTQLSPLTYPVKPSAEVLYPPSGDVRRLLAGDDDDDGSPKLPIGTLIGRSDVEVSISARQIVSRHLAILAMTGGGKTVAARRIIKELINIRYPLVIFDPHGDYLGFFEKRSLFKDTNIRIFYPMVRVRQHNLGIVADLIDKMGRKLTEAQQQFYQYLINDTELVDGESATDYIQRLIDHASNIAAKIRQKDHVPDELENTRGTTINAARGRVPPSGVGALGQ